MMFRRGINYLVKRAIGSMGPVRAFALATGADSQFVRDRAWSWLETNEHTLPEAIRKQFAAAKWESDWFMAAWFERPVHTNVLEVRHQLMALAQSICAGDQTITAADEYGCASGTFIRDVPLALPHLRAFRGWEYSQKARTLLAARYADEPRLTFHATSVSDLTGKPDRSIIFTIGTLQYMSQDELEGFLISVRQAQQPKRLLLAEISNHPLGAALPSSYRAHQTFNHSYGWLLRRAGFEIEAERAHVWKAGVQWTITSAKTAS